MNDRQTYKFIFPCTPKMPIETDFVSKILWQMLISVCLLALMFVSYEKCWYSMKQTKENEGASKAELHSAQLSLHLVMRLKKSLQM